MHTFTFFKRLIAQKNLENQWKSQWRGETYFAHGTVHSRGVSILVRNTLDFRPKSVKSDEEGRFLCLEAIIQDELFLLVSIYAPNTNSTNKVSKGECNQILSDEHLDKTNKFDWSALQVPRFSTKSLQRHERPPFVARILVFGVKTGETLKKP